MALNIRGIPGVNWWPALVLVAAGVPLLFLGLERVPSRTSASLVSRNVPQAETPPALPVSVAISHGEFIPATVRLKALRAVRLELSSLDDEYMVEIPGVIGPTRVPAGGTVKAVFTPVQLGALELRTLGGRPSVASLLVQPCPPEAIVPNPVAATTESVGAGASLYARECSSCHGLQGRGDGTAISRPGLRPVDFTQPWLANISDGELHWVISQGWQGMPAFKDRLSTADRWNLVNYLRTLSQD